MTFCLSSSQPTSTIYLRDESNVLNHIWIIICKVYWEYQSGAHSDICILCVDIHSGPIAWYTQPKTNHEVCTSFKEADNLGYIYLIKTTRDKEFFSAYCQWCWHTAYVSWVIYSCRHMSGLVLTVPGCTSDIYNGGNNLLTINMVGRFVSNMFSILINYTIHHIHSCLGNTRRWNIFGQAS